MNRNQKIIIIGVLVLICGYFVLKTDYFQRTVFPKKYWEEKVRYLESSIKTDEILLRDSAIEVKKKQMTIKMDIHQDINIGLDRDEAINQHKIELESLIDIYKFNKEGLKKDQEELDKAKQELQKYQKKK